MPAQQLVRQGNQEPIFYDLYLRYSDGRNNMLYAIPLLVKNIKVGTTYPNLVSVYLHIIRMLIRCHLCYDILLNY